MIRLVIATVLLAVVAAFVFVRGRGNGVQRAMKVTARAGIARGATIAIVEVEGRRFLLGAAANAVNVLAELDAAPADPSEPSTQPAPRQPLPTGPATDPVAGLGATGAAGAAGGAGGTPIDRLRSMTVRTPSGARRAFQVGP